jgi:hypothetical protein
MFDLNSIRQRLRAGLRALAGADPGVPQAATNATVVRQSSILDAYLATPPDPQNSLDIFRGEWSSCLPAPFAQYQAGPLPLFEDERIDWAIEQFGGVQGRRILELGPLEGGHSYMLARGGAAEVLAIEANTRAFLRCLIVKELLGMPNVSFRCGDFMAYLHQKPPRFDICIASGVLYHMRNPAELLALIAASAEQCFVWTHYYDADVLHANPLLSPHFTGQESAEYAGFRHTLYHQEYDQALERAQFCGGSATYCRWMGRDDILSCIQHFGFSDIRIAFEDRDHPHGPCFAFVARR